LTIAEKVVWKTRKLHQEAKAKGYSRMTNSADEEIEKAQKKYGLTFDFYTCDAIALKKPLKGQSKYCSA
jgi:transposase-like protein